MFNTQIYFCLSSICTCFIMTAFWVLKSNLSVNYLFSHWVFFLFQILFILFLSLLCGSKLFIYILLKSVIDDIITEVIKVKIQLILSTLWVGYAAV